MTILQIIREKVRGVALFAAGVDKEVLSLCSSAEKGKYSMLGSLVYIPVATSTVGILFAASYFTSNPLTVAGVVFGWGLVVFLIERAIIAHLRPGEVSLAVFARVILALALSTIVAELLTVYVFRQDIDDLIRRVQATEIAAVDGSAEARITALKAELDGRKGALDAKQQAYLDEIDGRSGTRVHGYGPSARAKEEAYLSERREYEDAKARLEVEIAEARTARDAAVAATAGAQQTGLLQAFTALYEMAAEKTTILVVLIILHIYLLLVELLPLTVKLHMKGGNYYDILDKIDGQRLDTARELVALKANLELSRRRLEFENEALRTVIDMASEKALIQSQGIVASYVSLSESEDKASAQLADSYLSSFRRQHEEVFDHLVTDLSAIVTNA